MRASIHDEYERRRSALAARFAHSAVHRGRLTQAMLVVIALLVVAIYREFQEPRGIWWWLVPLVAIAALLLALARARAEALRTARLIDVYEAGEARMDGSRVQSGHAGEAFREPGHLYDRDLNILGADSIFGMLATTRTAVGQRALAGLLLHGVDAATATARQAAVQELAPLLDLRERVALLGRSSFEELPAESFERWLDAMPPDGARGFAPIAGVPMRWILIAFLLAWVGLLALALLRHQEFSTLPRNLAAVFALQGAFALWLKPRVVAEIESAQRLPGQTSILREGLQLLQEQTFATPLLCRLQQDAQGEHRALNSLGRSLTLVEQRTKEWFYVPALLLAVGTHAAISLDAWKHRHGLEMRRWIAAWAEFEALLALSTYAAEHPANVYPEIVAEGPAVFRAAALAHPLLPAEKAVKNDTNLDDSVHFLLISGSNMAGKSTLLRSIGCNAVLALAGAPVCADALRMTALRIGASLALVDSLAESKSKFLAEVERMRDLVELARTSESSSGSHCLFLIDEVFSGTNSVDRRAAAEAVLRGLIGAGAIGALSTHDLALAELAEIPELKGQNLHMASPDENDPLGFDYRLKPGVNRTTNAMAIVRLLGLGG